MARGREKSAWTTHILSTNTKTRSVVLRKTFKSHSANEKVVMSPKGKALSPKLAQNGRIRHLYHLVTTTKARVRRAKRNRRKRDKKEVAPLGLRRRAHFDPQPKIPGGHRAAHRALRSISKRPIELPLNRPPPNHVHEELIKRLNNFCTALQARKINFWRLINCPRTYIKMYFCVVDLLSHEMALKRCGKAIPPQPFNIGGEPGESADGRCIAKGLPCAHLTKLNDRRALAILPLPADVEQSVDWRDIGFWVQN